MFQIFMIIGWAVLLIILLYVWADVREIEAIVKDNKRELLRSNFGGRSAAIQEVDRKESRGKKDLQQEKNAAVPKQKVQAGTASMKESDEQVLQEVLAEFLG